jgi:hypothetical protein
MASDILARLGISREMISKHVVAVEAPRAKPVRKARAKYLALGLTQNGKPRKGRSPNGTRREYRVKKPCVFGRSYHIYKSDGKCKFCGNEKHY